MSAPCCSVVIPSFQRGAVVVESLGLLLPLLQPDDELILVDQTPQHPPGIETALAKFSECVQVRWLRLPTPSIPNAMNVGLLEARSEFVLFLDDDIVPDSNLIEAHRSRQREAKLVAGMVLQPGERPCRLSEGDAFRFNSDDPATIAEFMGGNFSIKRDIALALGGFDQNFVGAAYRFEAEFAHRFVARFGAIQYEPAAVIHHLQVATGGTRSHGHHLRTLGPSHSVGAYYCLLRTRPPRWKLQFALRPLRAIRTRYHFGHPWRIPATLLAEFRGMRLAGRLHRGGPNLLSNATAVAPLMANTQSAGPTPNIEPKVRPPGSKQRLRPTVQASDISVVIPTYQREQVLLDTLEGLLALEPPVREILLVDQTPTHAAATSAHLSKLDAAGSIRWIRLPEPSVIGAMNHGLLQAKGEVVLFVDDDVVPTPNLAARHAEAQRLSPLVVGQVLQPGEIAEVLRVGESFRFNSTEGAWVSEFIGCNFSVNRILAIEAGGFDENFVGAAFRYEAEFSQRFTRLHGLIRFEPLASLRHLRASTGGTRAHGDHLRTISARHSVGAYYCLLMNRPEGWRKQLFLRPLRAVRTRHHLFKPWWIPLTLLAEVRGYVMAVKLHSAGPRLIETSLLPADARGRLLVPELR
ncbi:MAG: glycosyltransferase family 2 protein [Pseudomarimonas sp.]